MSDTKRVSNQSIKKIAPVTVTAFVAAMLVGAFSFTTTAFAAVSFDPESGTGFVGKGDVQTALGWNNKQLQDGASSLQFTFESKEVTEISWECTNNNNQKIQERERTTTTQTSGVVSSIERVKNQITGFNLDGFSSTTTSSDTDGPPLNSCPSAHTLTTPAGDPEVVEDESSSALYVNGVKLADV